MKRARIIALRRVEGSVEQMSDEALVAACATGDRAALGTLFDRHQMAMYRFLSRVSGARREELDDLVQSAFVEALSAARTFRGGSRVRTWLFGIAANVARHHTRSELRRRTALIAAGENESKSISTSSPQRELESKELFDRLRRALQALPHDLRVAFVLCDLEETRGVDAARALSIREGTLYRRLHEARRALRDRLRGDES